ncbi:unnamed protein product [Urochloa decumbens]|uniref:KIB1-4 beta-propeller domain-containing protein n=1 Tax=Urochloa decumbens TaxID=240449 RepID=A0ABC9D8M5_9POAL
MAGSRRRQLQRQRQREAAASASAHRDLPPKPTPGGQDRPSTTSIADLPPELLAQIQRRIHLADRLNLALAGYGGGSSWQEAPCLVLPTGESAETAKFISLSAVAAAGGCQVVTARAPDPAMRGHVVLGSSGGWLVTADLQGALRMANPVAGEQANLSGISTGTIPFHEASHGHVVVDMNALTLAAGGSGSSWRPPFTIANWQMRKWLYRKAVLSSSPRPGSSYAAMLILERHFGAAAFATAGDPTWRLARRHPSADSDGDSVEDAIFHDGRFHSLSYSGAVEAWDHDAETGEFVSTPVGPRLALPAGGEEDDAHHPRRRKYIAAAPDGRLVAVLKDSRAFTVEERRGWRSDPQHGPTFEIRVLDGARGRWEEEEAADIGDLALFVGVNASMCVSAREHPGIRAGCVYYAEDELGRASLRLEGERPHGTSSNACPSSMDDDDYELRDLGVYVLKHRRAEKVIKGIGRHCSWPLPAWFTPSVV